MIILVLIVAMVVTMIMIAVLLYGSDMSCS